MRVVGDQLHAGDAQVFHNLHGQVVLALVGLETEGNIGLDGVHAVVLERVSLDLVVQADAPAFLPEVDQSPRPVFEDHLKGHVQLFAAIAFEAAKGVAGETLAMDAHQHVVTRRPIADDQRGVFPAVDDAVVADDAGDAVPGGQVGFRDAGDQGFAHAPMGDELSDAEDLQVMFAGELLQLGHPRHGAVGVHDFADDAGRIGSRLVAQVNDRLGVAGAAQHAARIGAQREGVPRVDEVLRLRVGVNEGADGLAAVKGGDAGGSAALVVHGGGEGGGLGRR